jgi:hypothetical protein
MHQRSTHTDRLHICQGTLETSKVWGSSKATDVNRQSVQGVC